jgi:hypothetical protein
MRVTVRFRDASWRRCQNLTGCGAQHDNQHGGVRHRNSKRKANDAKTKSDFVMIPDVQTGSYNAASKSPTTAALQQFAAELGARFGTASSMPEATRRAAVPGTGPRRPWG